MNSRSLQSIQKEVDSAEYVVTGRSKSVMEKMLNGICADGRIFKDFEQEIEPLYDASPRLRGVAKLTDGLVDRTKEESLDLARALVINMPTHARQPSGHS